MPLVEAIENNLGRKPEQASADSGYCSEPNLEALVARGIDGYIAPGRADFENGVSVVSSAAFVPRPVSTLHTQQGATSEHNVYSAHRNSPTQRTQPAQHRMGTMTRRARTPSAAAPVYAS